MEKQETPEFTRIVELLQGAGLKDRKAVELAERMSNIASQNTIAQFASKLEAGLEGLRAWDYDGGQRIHLIMQNIDRRIRELTSGRKRREVGT